MLFSKKLTLLLILVLFFCLRINSWQIRGVIRDISFRSVENASIHVKETGKYYISLGDGYFELSIPDNLRAITLVFESKDHYSKSLKIKFSEKPKPITIILVQREYIRNEIHVTAFDTEERSISTPKAQNVISELEIKEKISETLVDTLSNSPGVHFIGSGGFMTTPSIRGLARRRVLLMIDGVRITGDRRAGNSGSFLSPELIKQVEIVRSSSSVAYGSDAIGGVIQLITGYDRDRINSNRSFNLTLNNFNSRVSSGFSFTQKSKNFLVNSGFQYATANNYYSPEREIHNSGYTNLSGILNLIYSDDKRSVSLRYIGGSGRNIGKPDRENDPDLFSTVRENTNHIFILKYSEKELLKDSELKLNLFLNPTIYILDKGNLHDTSSESSDTRAVNSGFGLKFLKKLSKKIHLTSGMDIYLRNNLDIINKIENITDHPLIDGHRKDIGIFISAGISDIIGVNLRGGIRYTITEIKANSDSTPHTRKADSPSIFLGLIKNFSKSLSFFFNTGTSFRNPSLSESFYTGITGRRFVTGNPDLKPEKSFNIDSGIKLYTGNIFLGFYFFANTITDMIERYRSGDGIFSYDNINTGSIIGGEAEFQWFPDKNMELFGHFYYYHGRSSGSGDPLNDIPSPKLLLGGKANFGKSWLEINFLHSFIKSDPGPSEINNNSYDLITLKGGHYFSSKFFTFIKVSNLLNQIYYPNPDPDIPESDRINLSMGLNFFF